ncbi:hypothetical protein APHAL10511_007133 [Amanita phalloides]|nr:hypothetical protein APHAL10511_007133 [Amanita phalloides]
MIATILTQSHAMPQSKDPGVSRNSNAAGAPLPLIPRRAHSTTHLGNVNYNNVTVSRSSDSLNLVSQRGFPASNVDAGSTEPRKGDRAESLVNIRWRGAGRNSITTVLEQTRPFVDIGSKVNCYPPVQVRVTPPQHGTDNGSIIRHIPELDNRSSPPLPPQRLVRKKSGQLVKSSLKSSTSCSKGGLSIVTLGNSSKSEPTTPTLTKAVHFDPHLEHVKLFLAEQKPLAVSRDGSPTDDTSGTDSDFPSFIFGGEKKISFLKVNMPPLPDKSRDVALEDLSLVSEGTSIFGRVRLRNIAYTKSLTARFTFDGWLTISEVTGKYLETIDAAFDRFTFMIRLHDLFPGVEDRTLIFALRYAVAGREIWDNNRGRNYIVTIPQQTNYQSEVSLSGDISHLRSKLEKVVQSGGDSSCQRNCCQEHRRHSDNTNTLRASASLTSRYDIESSLKRPWAYLDSPQRCYNQPHLDDTTRPQPDKDIALVMPVPSLGSPRDLDTDTFCPAARATSRVDQILFSPNRPNRNHQRSYFDADRGCSGVKRTPPGTPLQTNLIYPTGSTSHATASHRRSSACDVVMVGNRSVSLKPEILGSGSDDSTPLLVTPSSSRSTSPSSTENEMVDVISDSELNQSPVMDYRQFLSR